MRPSGPDSVEARVNGSAPGVSYAVRICGLGGDARAECQCPDYVQRGGLCKHGGAVFLALLPGSGYAPAPAITPMAEAGPAEPSAPSSDPPLPPPQEPPPEAPSHLERDSSFNRLGGGGGGCSLEIGPPSASGSVPKLKRRRLPDSFGTADAAMGSDVAPVARGRRVSRDTGRAASSAAPASALEGSPSPSAKRPHRGLRISQWSTHRASAMFEEPELPSSSTLVISSIRQIADGQSVHERAPWRGRREREAQVRSEQNHGNGNGENGGLPNQALGPRAHLRRTAWSAVREPSTAPAAPNPQLGAGLPHAMGRRQRGTLEDWGGVGFGEVLGRPRPPRRPPAPPAVRQQDVARAPRSPDLSAWGGRGLGDVLRSGQEARGGESEAPDAGTREAGAQVARRASNSPATSGWVWNVLS